MRPLAELINSDDSALPMIQEFAGRIPGRCIILPVSRNSGDVLYHTQVTTRSPMGAIIYHTGGIFVDGWLRILGSGSEQIQRSLPDWNAGRSSGFCLVADDIVGGFFAIDGGSLGHSQGDVCYWGPDSLDWISLGRGFTDFLHWAMAHDFDEFYSALRWPKWREDALQLTGDRCFSFYPFLWTHEGSIQGSHRSTVPISEAFDSKVDILRQLSQNQGEHKSP